MAIEISVKVAPEAEPDAVYEKLDKALETCGQIAEGYAKLLCPVNTGFLRNSITHEISTFGSFGSVDIGTSVEYAPYVEFGTGSGAEGGGGSPPWVYTPDGGEHFYRTSGQPPKPFIRPSVADHEQEYVDIASMIIK